EAVAADVLRNLYDGVGEDDVDHALVMSARTLIEREPDYGLLAARLLLDRLRREALTSFDFMSSTPTLFNAGTRRPQLSSCYLTTVPDDLAGIYSAIRDNALLSKFAGGLGNDWTRVRSLGA